MCKVPDISMNKVAGDFWGNCEKVTVAYCGYFFDLPMMVLRKSQVRNEGGKILPAGK
jgi:hypothetical protein